MNKHWVLCLGMLALLSACNRSTDLAVRAVSEASESGQVLARAQQEIRLIPYDRDSLFVALAAQADEPEPQPPADLLELRDSVSTAQERWRQAEAIWNDLRSELQTLSERMKTMNRASNQYFQAYRRFDDLDGRVRRLDGEKQGYFERFTELQSVYNERADSFSAVLHSWEDAAFEDYGEIVDSLTEVYGEVLYDTTDANGWAYFQAPRGTWWVHTRAKLPFEELYWNEPFKASGGADTLVLNQSNADVRPVF